MRAQSASVSTFSRQSSIGVELRSTAPGLVHFQATSDHMIRMHAGPRVRGACHAQPFVYERGDIDLFPTGASDSWHEDDASTFLVLELSPALVRLAAEGIGRDPDRVALEPRHHFRDPHIEHIAWALDAERQSGYPSGSLYTESLGMALAVRLLGHSAAGTERGGLTPVQLRRVTAYIDAHLDRELSLAELAQVAGISVSHLKASFKRSTGMPVHRFVIQRRVDHAKSLLVDKRMPVSQAALESGFAHQSHLARWMRRLMGVTPSALLRP